MPLFDAADRQASCIREWHFSIFTLMKRIRCPKCDEAILFDDSLYTPGRTLVFECPTCRKQFKIRVGVKAATSNNAEQDFDGEQNEEERLPLGHLVVVENAFHLRQEIPLFSQINVKTETDFVIVERASERVADGHVWCSRRGLSLFQYVLSKHAGNSA